jgi:hypothetical protein
MTRRGKGRANDARLHFLVTKMGRERGFVSIGISLERFLERLLAVAASGAMAVVFCAGTAHAVPAYWYYTDSSTQLTYQGGVVAGVSYTTLQDVTFNSLGFIDLPNVPPTQWQMFYGIDDGLLGTYQVGIWRNDTQELLASTTVGPNSVSIDQYEYFRWSPIPATTIPANTAFTIGALLPANPQDAWLYDTYSVNSTGIMGPGGGRLIDPATTLSFPPLGSLGTLTGMQVIANASTDIVVPEPATAILLLVGCGFLAASRRAA